MSHRTAARRRAGFTLLELLVVLAIIAVLIGLLIPAIHKARLAAVRLMSLNNLRQISLGCHAYDSEIGQLPGTGKTHYQGTFIAFYDVLPYLEQDAVHREFGLSGGEIVPPSAAGVGPARVIRTYRSPADSSSPEPVLDGFALASYTPNQNAFGDNASLARSFPDGTSYTILLGERMMLCDDVPNRWFSPSPVNLVFGAAPPPSNYAPRPGACNPERVCTPHGDFILVALADGSSRSLSPAAVHNNWVRACNPEDGKPLDVDW
jgi:prepilin-type N-terminal cleavage/methylation domain-containing protein